MIRLTLEQIALIVDGSLKHGAAATASVNGRVQIDSRSVQPGDLFIAIKGDMFDGHDFVASALGSGAAGVISARDVDVPHIRVDDTVRALGLLARGVVTRLPELTVVALTGSSGKTSTKDLLAQMLPELGPTVAPQGSFNNETGLPLTALTVDQDTRFLVAEMGARGVGHIRYLCGITPPKIGLVLNVGSAHVGEFGSREAIARAKGELVEALPVHGVALLNADNPRVAAMTQRTSARSITFGVTGGDVHATNIVIDDDLRVRFDLHSEWGTASIRLGVRGVHHVGNALAAATLALLWDVPMADVVDGLEQAALSPWRMELHVSHSGVRVLNDAYNAGPASMEAALRAVAQLPGARHHAVLGPMAELGAESAAAHAHVASVAAELGIRLIAFGTDGYASAAAQTAHTIDDAVAALGELGTEDSVLVKGSRVAGLERLAAALLAD